MIIVTTPPIKNRGVVQTRGRRCSVFAVFARIWGDMASLRCCACHAPTFKRAL